MDHTELRPITTSEGRHSKRLHGSFPVMWKIDYMNLAGSGVIHNLSADGVCLQLDREFTVHPGALVMTVEAPGIPALPPEAKIRWFRRAGGRGEKSVGFRCGLVFLGGVSAERWSQWFRDALALQAAHATQPPVAD